MEIARKNIFKVKAFESKARPENEDQLAVISIVKNKLTAIEGSDARSLAKVTEMVTEFPVLPISSQWGFSKCRVTSGTITSFAKGAFNRIGYPK